LCLKAPQNCRKSTGKVGFPIGGSRTAKQKAKEKKNYGKGRTFSQAIVDSMLKKNAEFRSKAGLRPRIIRKSEYRCCEWCSKMEGICDCPNNVPHDVYRRHERCRCVVEYESGSGKRQNVWSKKWTTQEERAKIEARKAIGLNNSKSNSLRPASIAGVKLGKQMSFEEADTGNVNPNYGKSSGYASNCQTCVVAFEARQRGYDVRALPNTKGSMLDTLSRKTNLAWIDPATGNHPDYIFENKTYTAKSYKAYLESIVEPDKRYTLEFAWKGRGSGGHIVNLDRNSNGQLRIKDNQRGNGEPSEYIGDRAVTQYLSRIKYSWTSYGLKFNAPPKVLRVDNMQFDLTVVGKILEGVK